MYHIQSPLYRRHVDDDAMAINGTLDCGTCSLVSNMSILNTEASCPPGASAVCACLASLQIILV